MRNGHFASPWAWLALSWVLLLALLLLSPNTTASKVAYLENVVSNSENGAGQGHQLDSPVPAVVVTAHASHVGSSDASVAKADALNPLVKRTALTDGGTPIYRSRPNYPATVQSQSPPLRSLSIKVCMEDGIRAVNQSFNATERRNSLFNSRPDFQGSHLRLFGPQEFVALTIALCSLSPLSIQTHHDISTESPTDHTLYWPLRAQSGLQIAFF